MRILNDEKLKELSFLSYLKKMKDFIGEIDSYMDSSTFISHIKHRSAWEANQTWEQYKLTHEGSMLYNDGDILTKYRMAKTEKAKKGVIDEFKDNINDDLFDMIMAREQN